LLLTVKNNQRRLHQQILSQFRGHRHFPVVISDVESSHGRLVHWQLRARNATDAILEHWVGASWIVELVSTGRRGIKPFQHVHYVLTTLRTSPKALLRLIRQRWSIENEWPWSGDKQIGEDAHLYSKIIGAPVYAFLRAVAMNLLRRGGYRSIRQGRRELAYNIKGMLALEGIQLAKM
jgi:predicted transposase YbfD/YdcC